MQKQTFRNPDCLNAVATFHRTFEHVILDAPGIPDDKTRLLRNKLIHEEFEEFMLAAHNGDIYAVADALADLQYVLTGTILAYGLGSKFKAIFDEVQRSNMTKACDTEEEAMATIAKINETGEVGYFIQRNGKYLVRRRVDDKTVKSVNYSPAYLEEIITEPNTVSVGQVWIQTGGMAIVIVGLNPFFDNVHYANESGWEHEMPEVLLKAQFQRVERVDDLTDELAERVWQMCERVKNNNPTFVFDIVPPTTPKAKADVPLANPNTNRFAEEERLVNQPNTFMDVPQEEPKHNHDNGAHSFTESHHHDSHHDTGGSNFDGGGGSFGGGGSSGDI